MFTAEPLSPATVDLVLGDVYYACRDFVISSYKTVSDEEISAATDDVFIIVDSHLKRILEAGRSHRLMVHALNFIAKACPPPRSRTDLAWLQYTLDAVLEIAVPQTQLTGKSEQAFLVDMSLGVSERVAHNASFVGAFEQGKESMLCAEKILECIGRYNGVVGVMIQSLPT